MSRIVLVHWNDTEWPERAARLRALDHTVVRCGPPGPEALRAVRENPPDAFVIDLGRLPSHGREVASVLRQSKSTRLVPIVFVEGDPEKVKLIQEQLPDARYTHWALIGPVLDHALRHPPTEVVVPRPLAGYTVSPLPKKLGINTPVTILLYDAPEHFENILGHLPEGSRILRNPKIRVKGEIVILFARTARALRARFPAALRSLALRGSLWIAWPKKSSNVPSDLSQPAVREFVMGEGLVDFKICAIDETWSGLRFARRNL